MFENGSGFGSGESGSAGITDFEELDAIEIDHNTVNSYSGLAVARSGSGTKVTWDGNIAALTGIASTSIGAGDFIFV